MDENCDGVLSGGEQRDWARGLQAAVGVAASAAPTLPAAAAYGDFLSAAAALAEEGAKVDAFFARHLAPLQQRCSGQTVACQLSCACVRDALSARSGSIEAAAGRRFPATERAPSLLASEAAVALFTCPALRPAPLHCAVENGTSFCLYAADGTAGDAEARCALLGGSLAAVESAARRSALNAFHGHLHSCTATQLASEKRACYAWK